MFKYCPKCKSSAISFVNNHYLSCVECDFLYYHNAAAAVAVIIKCHDEILFTVRGKNPGINQLDLPGGFVDHNETLEEALTREVHEELSIKIQSHQFRYFTSEPNTYQYQNVKYNTIDSIFTLELDQKLNVVCESAEIKTIFWVKENKIDINLLAFESTKKAMIKYLN